MEKERREDGTEVILEGRTKRTQGESFDCGVYRKRAVAALSPTSRCISCSPGGRHTCRFVHARQGKINSRASDPCGARPAPPTRGPVPRSMGCEIPFL